MFSAEYFRDVKPRAFTPHDLELIAELKAIISRPKVSPAKTNSTTVSRKLVAKSGNIPLTKSQIAQLYKRTFNGEPLAYGKTVSIK